MCHSFTPVVNILTGCSRSHALGLASVTIQTSQSLQVLQEHRYDAIVHITVQQHDSFEKVLGGKATAIYIGRESVKEDLSRK